MQCSNCQHENRDEAKVNGRAALDGWRHTALVYPFQWAALWPLIDVALRRNEISIAMNYARRLLEPTQQRLPDELTAKLEKAIQAQERGELQTAQGHLSQAIELAQEMGHL